MQTGLDKQLRGAALRVGRDWKRSPYYDAAEQGIERQWRELVWPFLTDPQGGSTNFSETVALAAGHGRTPRNLLPLLTRWNVLTLMLRTNPNRASGLAQKPT